MDNSWKIEHKNRIKSIENYLNYYKNNLNKILEDGKKKEELLLLDKYLIDMEDTFLEIISNMDIQNESISKKIDEYIETQETINKMIPILFQVYLHSIAN